MKGERYEENDEDIQAIGVLEGEKDSKYERYSVSKLELA